MATWIAHMRIAQMLMALCPNINHINFLAGNIAPDCGVPNASWTEFTPPKTITHFINKDSEFKYDAPAFKAQYISNIPMSDEQFAFYMGYYVHLLTDIKWHQRLLPKMQEPLYIKALNTKDGGGWPAIKADWYGLDHLYLQSNPDAIFYSDFMHIKAFPNIYLDFFPMDAFTRQFKHIQSFYTNATENPNRPFYYLSKSEMDGFVDEAASAIHAIIGPM